MSECSHGLQEGDEGMVSDSRVRILWSERLQTSHYREVMVRALEELASSQGQQREGTWNFFVV